VVQHFRTSLVALGQLMLVGLGLAFVAVPQSALFVQEAPARSFGAVTAFRTTCGQLPSPTLLLVIGALQNQVSQSAGAGATPSSPGPDGG
jgi:hypothetical protein